MPQAAGKDGRTLLAHILYWTSGHSYLTQRLCAATAQSPEVIGAGDIDHLVKRLFLSRRASAAEDVNLTFVRDRLLKSDLDKDKLFGLYQTIHEGKRTVADDPRDPYCTALRLSGIVTEREGFLFVRNRVYRALFSLEWAQEQMPGIEAAQHRRAVRRARLQIGSVAAAIVLALSVLTGIALWNANRAHKNAQQLQIALTDSKAARNSADRYLYIANLNLIQRDYKANNIKNVLSLLEQTRNSHYRGFEWDYWNRLCHVDQLTLKTGYSEGVNAVAISPDGMRIATVGDESPLEIWDSGTGQQIRAVD